MDELTVTARIRAIHQEGAELTIGNQTLTWPLSALPDGTQAGDQLVLRAQTPREAERTFQEQARAILAEMLGSES